MATTTIKQRLFTQLLGLADADAAPEETLPVLEQFIYGLCRENATREHADAAFARLKDGFFDWNEIRVSSNREIEEALEGLNDAETRSQRILSFLQEVFETEFTFDLESMHKKGLKVSAKSLLRYGASNDYVGAWVVQRTLGGHAIPVDTPTLRCAQRLGIIEEGVEEVESVRATLEHLVPKTKNQAFTDAISEVAERYCWEGEPNCPACPLRAECPTGQRLAADSAAAGRATRAKPR